MPRLVPKLDPPPAPPPPTEEQQFIIGLRDTTTANIMIDSVAGSGKTTMLEMLQADRRDPTLCLAFNTRIADRMRNGEKDEFGRLIKAPFNSLTTVKTLNSLGHGIWGKAASGGIVVNAKKCQDLLRDKIKTLPKNMQGEAYAQFWEIISAIGLAKSLGYVPSRYFPNAKRLIDLPKLLARCEEDLSDISIDLLDETLVASIKLAYAGLIDFNDQVYMPALFGGTYPRHPLVLVDEAQDLSPVNHEMLFHLRSSRVIAVGDPWQSIYGFRGAVQSGMAKLRTRFQMIEAPLSVSFRCPKAIVENARWRVPHMKWIRDGGRVAQLRNPNANSFTDGSAVICRNNAPLFALALRLLRAGRSVSVGGSDIGPRIVGIMKRLGDDSDTREELLKAIEGWRNEKLEKESKVANDIADCMRVFAEHGDTLSQAIAYAESLFRQEGTITLLTGHKAKGLEWDVVYHLDPWIISEHEQDLNLRYVIQTRSLNEYYEIDSRDIQWSRGQ